MSFIIFLLSAILIAGGSSALIMGFDIVTTERGLALTLCGTMALSIGVVVLALGFILVRLGKLKLAQSVSDFNYTSEPAGKTGLRRDLQDDVSANLSDMKTFADSASSATRSYKTAGALAAGAGAMAAGMGLAGSGFASKLAEQEKSNLSHKPAENLPDYNALDVIESDIDHGSKETSENERLAADTRADEIHSYSDDTFADLDKLIDELAVETSATVLRDPHVTEPDASEEFKTAFSDEPPSQSYVPNIAQNVDFSQSVTHVQPENISVEHVLPVDGHDTAYIPETSAPASEIIGAYDSGGVTYTLYADGGVVAEAGERREQYSSLEALKAALEDGTSVFKS